MFGELPDGWVVVDSALVEYALAQARTALEDPALTERRLVDYYCVEGNYAGATFLSLNPNPPDSIVPSDLLAVTMLSVEIPQVVVRRMIDSNPTSAHLNRLLRDRELPADRGLVMAGPDTLAKMSEFYEAVKLALAPVGVRNSDRWVTASKLCARKRPDLFPVRDDVVSTYLGSRSTRDYTADWQIYCVLLEDRRLMESLDAAVRAASRHEGVNVWDYTTDLRHLDVALWMHAVAR